MLPAINPSNMQTPTKTPVEKAMPGAPEKNTGTLYPLPALVAAKLEGLVKNLDNEFVLALPENQKITLPVIPKLAIPSGTLIEPEVNSSFWHSSKPEEGAMAPRNLDDQMPEEEEETYSEWYERQVKEFKEDMREYIKF